MDFYNHNKPLGWKNRLIPGDSLLVMNSLLEKEGLGGQVQMVYIDPPYGIRYGSNFQPFTNKRDVKDGSGDDLTLEPETLKAFRDTWEWASTPTSPISATACSWRRNCSTRAGRALCRTVKGNELNEHYRVNGTGQESPSDGRARSDTFWMEDSGGAR